MMKENVDNNKTNQLVISASTISTHLILVNFWLSLSDLPGKAGGALYWVLTCLFLPLPYVLGYLRLRILPHLLVKAGHADNDLRVLNREPQSCLGRFQRGLTTALTFIFSVMCSVRQSYQLQSSKVIIPRKQICQRSFRRLGNLDMSWYV